MVPMLTGHLNRNDISVPATFNAKKYPKDPLFKFCMGDFKDTCDQRRIATLACPLVAISEIVATSSY
jgi:hypothetical protein